MQQQKQKKAVKALVNDFRCDVIGKPDPVTNLRPIVFYVPEKETTIERQYRLERYLLQEWNHRFWRRHNEMFTKEKEEFRQKHTVSQNSNTSDEVSKFYKDFLDRHWKTHCRYNFQWYKKNIYLTMLALRVNVSRFLKYCKL